MKLCTFNINGLIRYLKTDRNLNRLLLDNGIDICCFQETKLSGLNRDIFAIPLSNVYLNSSKSSSGYCGIGFVFKESLPLSISIDLPGFNKNEEARYFESHFNDFILINVYVPNADLDSERFTVKENFLYFLSQRIFHLQTLNNVIIVGDFNISHCPLDSYYAKEDENFDKHPLRVWFTEFLSEHNLVDIYRHFHPTEVKYTCWNTYLDSRSSNCGSRIDYILVNQSFLPFCNDCSILDDFHGSDHCPVVLEILDSKLSPSWRNNTLETTNNYLNYSYKSKTISDFFGLKRKTPDTTSDRQNIAKKKTQQSTLLTHFKIEKETVKCKCNQDCALKQVIKKGPNKGRYFYCCQMPFAVRCDFFKWQKQG